MNIKNNQALRQFQHVCIRRPRRWWRRFIAHQRLRMANVEALPQLAIMGVISGLAAGIIIIGFRWLVEFALGLYLPEQDHEAFEDLSPHWRLTIAAGGGLIVGIMFQLAGGARSVGVVHVLERLGYHQGYLPLRNAVFQFFGAAVSLASGHSVGREGPNIHLGAATASLLGTQLALPNNSVRTLVGCGVAAAIAAGFNTPLAGVIFAMEVVLMEYTIVGFAPIILAAVSATALTRLVYGEAAVFSVPTYSWSTVGEFHYVLILGIAVGILAAAFSKLTALSSRLLFHRPVWLRLSLAGVAVGLIAYPIPQVMGIGYDTVNAALFGEMAIGLMALIILGKLIATSLCIGLGSPGGLIAPTLVMGACAGGVVGLGVHLLIDPTVSHGFYAMLGMGAMMAATLQAPLAALVALLEFTANPNIIMPGMLAIISAALINRVVFKRASIYRLLMQTHGLDFQDDPVSQALQRIGVASVMDRNLVRVGRKITRGAAVELLKARPNWFLVREHGEVLALLPAANLAHHVEQNPGEEDIDLMEIPAMRKDLVETNIRASLQHALDQLDQSGKGALYITRRRKSGTSKIHGVLTRADIERSYKT